MVIYFPASMLKMMFWISKNKEYTTITTIAYYYVEPLSKKTYFFSLKEKLTQKISTTNFFACVFPALSYPLPTWNWMTSLMSAMAWECMLSSAARAWSPPSLPPPPPPPTRPTNSLLDKLRIVFVLWKEIQDNTNTYKASFTCLNVFKKIDRICR